jgi:hypothetical protein
VSGHSGVSGYSAWSGVSGYSGWSGVSGVSGASTSGWSGVSGISGETVSGWSGYSGVSGESGTSTSGYSGVSGFSGAFAGSGTSGYVPYFTGANSLDKSSIYDAGSGYVGIGTTDPQTSLHIENTLGGIRLGRTRNDYGPYFDFWKGVSQSRRWMIQLDSDGVDNDNLYFYSANKTGGAANVVTFMRDGNVGINNTTPSVALELGVSGTSGANVIVNRTEGAELITFDGSAGTGTNFTWDAGWTWGSSKFTHNAGGGVVALSTVWTPTIGQTYKITISSTDSGTGDLTPACGGQTYANITASGTNTYTLVALSAAPLTLTPTNSNWTGTITAVSIKLLTLGNITAESLTLNSGQLIVPEGNASYPSLANRTNLDVGVNFGPAGIYNSINGTICGFVESTGFRVTNNNYYYEIGGGSSSVIYGSGGTYARIYSAGLQTLQLGYNSATAVAQYFKGPDGSGTDKVGGSLYIEPGAPTGAGVGGDLIFRTAPAGTTGSSVQSYINRMVILSTGNVGIGVDAPTQKLDISSGHINFTPITKPTAPTLALTAGGTLTDGTHSYSIAFVTSNNEQTDDGTYASIVVASPNSSVILTNIPVSPDSRVTKRKIYRCDPPYTNHDPDYLVYTINDNTTTTVTDTGWSPTSSDRGNLTADNTAGKFYKANLRLFEANNQNLFVGYRAGNSTLPTANYNTYVGSSAATTATSATNNTYVGWGAAGQGQGSYNVAVGIAPLFSTTAAGTFNIAIGYSALQKVTSGANNVGLGAYTGFASTTNGNNIFLGNNAGRFETGSYKLIVDNLNRSTEAASRTDALIYGVMDATAANQTLTLGGGGNVGIGILAPTAQLHLVKADSSALTDLLINPTLKTSGNLIQAQVGSVDKFYVDYAGGINTKGNAWFFTDDTSIRFGTSYDYANGIQGGAVKELYIFGYFGLTKGIAFQTGNPRNTKMYLANSGNLGIGTITPTANLQVAQTTVGIGTVAVSGTAVTGTNTQFTNTFKVGDTITVTTTSGAETKAITTITSDTVLVTDAFAGTAAAGTAYTLVGGTRFSVLGNGNVGIGTTAPTAQLHLVKADSSALTDFLINPTLKTSGNLIQAQVGSVDKFYVTYNGSTHSAEAFSNITNTVNYAFEGNGFKITGYSNNYLRLNGDLASGSAFYFIGTADNIELTDTDAEQSWINIQPNINQSGTASYSALKISVLETATGSGSKYLIDTGTRDGAGVHTSKFWVNNTGIVSAYSYYTGDAFRKTGCSAYYDFNGSSALQLLATNIRFYQNSDSTVDGIYSFRGGDPSWEMTASSGSQACMLIGPYINQSATAGYDIVRINVTETGVGSGNKNLINAQVGSVSKAQIQNTGAFSSTLINNADSDTDEIDSVTWAGGFGMLIACSVTDSTSAVWRLKGTTFIAVSVDGDWTSTKDTAASYNVYFESGAIKLQNKVGDNKNVKLGFYGML